MGHAVATQAPPWDLLGMGGGRGSSERRPLPRHFDGMARAADLLAEPRPANGTVQIAAGGGSQGMDPMHPPAAPDIEGMDRLAPRSGDRRR